MGNTRLRVMLVLAVLSVTSALTGLSALATAPGLPHAGEGATDWHNQDASELPDLTFAERVVQAGSVDTLLSAAADAWVEVAAGVDYRRYRLPGPVVVHVARMHRDRPDLFIETGIALGKINGGLERTSDIFSRYDQAVSRWGQERGGTNNVLVAVNGSFFDPAGRPDRGVIHSGWYAKRFTDYQNGSGFVWKLDRSLFIGQCVVHSPGGQLLSYLRGGGFEPFQGINVARGADELVLYTPQYDKATGTGDAGVEVLVALQQPMLIMPPPHMAVGTVLEIRDRAGDSSLYFDQIVLSASGSARVRLLENLQVGDRIGISNSLTSYESDCETPLAVDWTKAYAGLGGSYYFLRAGRIASPGATPANPLTAFGFNDRHIFFIVVDGRDPGYSIGMTIDQLADFVKSELGADHAISQDGGGSSTMVIDGVVVNQPSDRTPVDCTTASAQKHIQPDTPARNPSELHSASSGEADCHLHSERAVANSIMMVSYQPPVLSWMFAPGQHVVTLVSTEVFLGPGTNHPAIATLPAGSTGVVGNKAGMNGVLAKGDHWWLVEFEGLHGWVAEDDLSPAPERPR